MTKKKKYLTVLLIFLILLFFAASAGGYWLIRHERIEEEEIQRLDHLADLKQAERDLLTPTPTITMTPTPTPKPSPTPTPVVKREKLFDPDDFWNTWYSPNGNVTVNVYQISENAISFSYHQAAFDGSGSIDADVSAEIAGNAAEVAFYDSWGNYAEGSLVFQGLELYLKVETVSAAGGAPVSPKVNAVLQRNKPVQQATATPTPEPEEKKEEKPPVQNGDYFFADSSSRYLTDEEMEQYSSAQLELAKNEIYARHGRQFVTDYIASYFESKSWYQGTIAPDVFDAQADSVFNEYELSNIQKIVEWEARKRNQGE